MIYNGMSLQLLRTTAVKSITFDEWRSIGRRIYERMETCFWALGDWVNAGDAFVKEYGAKYRKVMEETGFEYGTLRNVAYVCRRVDPSRRRDKLSFSMHAEVASCTARDQSRFLKLALEKSWTRAELRAAVRQANASEAENAERGGAEGFLLNRAVGDITRWMRGQLEATPLDRMNRERREALRQELRPIVDLYEALAG